ncbi:MAG: hypothetical protein HYT76_01730 [Deltaproteobacteria bacterium]|nr:hypothetical protein [Deltaproteobacteria bacterium]
MSLPKYALGNAVLGGVGALVAIAVFNRLSDEPCKAQWGAVASGTIFSGMGCIVGAACGSVRYGAPLFAFLGTGLIAFSLPS